MDDSRPPDTHRDTSEHNRLGHTSFGNLPISVSFGVQKTLTAMNQYYVILAKDLANGSREAFKIIYNDNFNIVLNFALKFVSSREEAEDVSADVFMKVWEQRRRFEDITDIRRFIFAMVRNRCIDFLNSRSKRTERERAFIAQLESERFTEEAKSQYEEDRLRVQKWIDALPEKCKLVFNLAIFEELKIDEISARLGISYNTVQAHKGNAVRYLKTAFNSQKPIILTLYLLKFICSW